VFFPPRIVLKSFRAILHPRPRWRKPTIWRRWGRELAPGKTHDFPTALEKERLTSGVRRPILF
jgi:hypothetical protein